MSPLLRVHNLHMSFQGREVLHGMSFEMQAGEKLALVGESGSGKTVTALSLLGLARGAWVRGEALFEGQDLLHMTENELRGIRGSEIAMVFQEPMTALNPLFTIGDQIAEVLELKKGLSRQDAWQRAIDLLNDTGIPEPERRVASYPHQLSGGQRQRAMIAMALAGEPKLLLADEPTTALDVSLRGQILALLDSLQAKHNMAVLLITHDLNMVRRFAQRVVVMENGLVVEQGAVAQVLSQPAHPYTQGLLRARPSGKLARSERLHEIPGMVAAPSRERLGCPFAARCASALPQCAREQPPVVTPAPGRLAACWLVSQGAAP